MKKTRLVGWTSALAGLLAPTIGKFQVARRLAGSQQRVWHNSAQHGTYRANTKRSRDRAERRSGEISARQQRLANRTLNRILKGGTLSARRAA